MLHDNWRMQTRPCGNGPPRSVEHMPGGGSLDIQVGVCMLSIVLDGPNAKDERLADSTSTYRASLRAFCPMLLIRMGGTQ